MAKKSHKAKPAKKSSAPKRPPPLAMADNPLAGALGNYSGQGYPKAAKHAFQPNRKER